MKAKEFLDLSARTGPTEKSNAAVKERLQDDNLLDILHGAIGMSGESGEFLDAVKKTVLYGKSLDKNYVEEELGDSLYYMALVLRSIGSNFETVMQKNYEKLLKRYPEGYNDAAAIARADKQ
jgi:NTP pyrophosphatase (non-canonical NTP hydrolase)